MKAFCQIYAQLDQTGDRIQEEARYLLDLGLICDTTFGFAQAVRNQAVLHEIRAAGGLCAPNVYPADCDPARRDPNWWKYSEDECLRLLGCAKERFLALGFGPMDAVNTYTPGNGFVSACRRLNIGYILGFCAPTVIEDGGWEIAHYGSPLSPYFVSREDYRKPAPAGDPGGDVLIASMELRNPMVCLNHWSEGPWCPLNAQAADRWLEPSGDPLPFIQIAEDWLRQSELGGRELFFHINLQYFFADRCYEHNRRALAWLAEQRDKRRLEIGGLERWADRLRESGGFGRQTTCWRGEMMGFHVGHRSGCFPDVVVDESLDHQAVWQKPDPLPKRLYDYQKCWDWPAFEPSGSAPASDVFQEVEVETMVLEREALSRRWKVAIRNDGGARKVAVMVWDAFDGLEAPFVIEDLAGGWRGREIPHPSGAGGAVLLEGHVCKGSVALTLTCKGRRPVTHRPGKSWPDLVEAQTFFRGGRPYTVLAAQTPEPFLLMAKITRRPHDREPITVEHLIGIEHETRLLRGERVALRFDGVRLACWHRIWGVTADQIELLGVDEVKARLKKETQSIVAELLPELAVDEPGYQLFGNIRDVSRWDRKLARVAGAKEMDRMNAWLRAERPGAGNVVIEAHPGIFLPRGSITKVLGHEFDFVRCAEGYGFRELCVDYPQSWDWGAAAWVQWRHLRVRIDGLKSAPGRHVLHLHAFDPEERDICQRVHFFNPDESRAAPNVVHRSTEICAVDEWVLPRGVEGRWNPEALSSILVPDECKAWKSLGVWIVPLEKKRLYDWVGEAGAPGLLSHLWMTVSDGED